PTAQPYVPAAAAPPLVPPTAPPPPSPPPIRQRTGGGVPGPGASEGPGTSKGPGAPGAPDEGGWRTSADNGWVAAAGAAIPKDGGTTRSGLPKRVPAAQLVPGAVDGRNSTARKRTPDEVRGLLSAYHRGVQRGRTSGEGTSFSPRSDPEEKH